MPWHDAIADYKGLEGWVVTLRWTESTRALSVGVEHIGAQGGALGGARNDYDSLTTNEALDVVCASVSGLLHPQMVLPGF